MSDKKEYAVVEGRENWRGKHVLKQVSETGLLTESDAVDFARGYVEENGGIVFITHAVYMMRANSQLCCLDTFRALADEEPRDH